MAQFVNCKNKDRNRGRLAAWMLITLLIAAGIFSGITGSVQAEYSNEMEISSRMIVEANTERVISDTKITISDRFYSSDSVILVKSGAVLTIKDSWFDLSNVNNRTAIEVEEGAALNIDHSEISGANGIPPQYFGTIYGGYSCFIFVNGGTLNITNGSVIRNNSNNGYHGFAYNKFSFNIITVLNGNLSFVDSYYQHNTGRRPVHIITKNTDINIEKSYFTDNFCFQLILAEEETEQIHQLRISDSQFKDNQFQDFSYALPNAVIAATKTRVKLENENSFINNKKAVALEIFSSKLSVSGKNKIVNNLYGLNAALSDITIENTEFTENEKDAFRMNCKCAVSIDNCKFDMNNGDAIRYNFFRDEIDHPFTDISWHEAWINYYEKVENEYINITNSSFTNNKSGAVYIGDNEYEYLLKDENIKIPVNIENCKFIDNDFSGSRELFRKKDDKRFVGGAVYFGDTAEVHMKNLIVMDNHSENEGGGIAVGPDGQLIIHPRYGAEIISNGSNTAGDYKDIFISNSEIRNEISEKMLNGGSHNWKTSDVIPTTIIEHKSIGERRSISELCNGDPECIQEVKNACLEEPDRFTCEDDWFTEFSWELFPKELEGYAMGSNPDSLDIPEDVSVLVQGNTAGSDDGEAAYGGGIVVNGILEVGEPGVSVSVRKIWNVSGESVPEPETFLPWLQLIANGEPYDLGALTLKSRSEAENQEVSVFTTEKDRFVTIRVTDSGENTYEIVYEDLPLEKDGEALVYSIEEHSNDYDGQISGNMEEGFVIVNTPKPREEGMNLYRIFDEMHELPRTGFSAVHPQALPAQPWNIGYKPSGLTLQIPSLSVSAEIVTIPYSDGAYPVEWLREDAGLLEGSSLPGEGVSVITGHNHLNTTEAGPFALLQNLEAGDMIFVLDKANRLRTFSVFASEKIAETDTATLQKLASEGENVLLLLSCEDERPEGGYANRRLIAARPVTE